MGFLTRTQVGTHIVNDSLIFYYDMNNKQRSFKGKPTTNLFAGSVNDYSGWDVNNTDHTYYDPSPEVKFFEKTTSTVAFYTFKDSTLDGTSQYTQSIYVKPVEREYLQIAPSDGFPISQYANYYLNGEGSITGTGSAKATITLIKFGRYSGWYRCTYTETSNSSFGRMIYAIVNSSAATRLESYSGTIGSGLLILDPQLEVNSFATPFVDGTRSDTQSLVDLKGGHEITVKDLTYPNDNRGFNFSSTTSRLDIEASALSAQASSGNWTIEMWLKRTALSGGIEAFLQTGSGNNFLWYFRLDTGTVELENTARVTWSFTPTTGVYYHFVATGTGGTVEVFINGVSLGTNAATTTFSIAYANGICVGQELDSNAATPSVDPNQRFQGEIPLVRFYDRVLADAEVRQNFIAQRKQFGL